jgi:hypothetical protein
VTQKLQPEKPRQRAAVSPVPARLSACYFTCYFACSRPVIRLLLAHAKHRHPLGIHIVKERRTQIATQYYTKVPRSETEV